MQHKIPNRIYAKQRNKIVCIHDVALRLAHLVIVLQKPRVPKHLMRQLLAKRHQKDRPVNRVETNNILSNQMQVRRP